MLNPAGFVDAASHEAAIEAAPPGERTGSVPPSPATTG